MRRYISQNSGVKHKNYVDETPLLLNEMYRRSLLGIPLSVPQPKDNNIPVNNRFYSDDFDVIDIAIKNDMRISEEERLKQLEANAKFKAEQDEFLAWKKQREAEISKGTITT